MITERDVVVGQPMDLGPITLTIESDGDRICPWEDWPDGLAPVAFLAGRSRTDYDLDGDMFRPLDDVKPAWVARNRMALWSALKEVTLRSADEMEEEARARASDYAAPDGCARLDLMREALAESESDGGSGDAYLDAVAALWRLRGFHADTFQRNGHSQSDRVYILVAHTPGFLARAGLAAKAGKRKGRDTRDRDSVRKDMARDADLLAAWIFGDVYGYTLETEDGGIVDSCWGFYGCPWGHNPSDEWDVLEAAKEALAPAIASATRSAVRWACDASRRLRDLRHQSRNMDLSGGETPALDSLIRDGIEDALETWRAARDSVRAWRELETRVATS